MPIMDGYRATHIIRTEQPFKNLTSIRNIPIVAMTASAIQGDKEKCRNAGMDDYLAKPVKGKLLERMLVKWATESKRKQKLSQRKQASRDRQYSEKPLERSPESIATAQRRSPVSPIKDEPTRSENDPTKVDDSLKREINRIDYDTRNTLSKSSENPNDRLQRRIEAEEKASSLRDDGLLSVADDPRTQQHSTKEAEKAVKRDSGPRHALIHENMDKFAGAPAELLQWRNLPQNSMSASMVASPARSRSYDNNTARDAASQRPSLKAMRGHRSEWNVNTRKGKKDEG